MKTLSVEIYDFDELAPDIQDKVVVENNNINTDIGNSALESWLADTTKMVSEQLQKNITLNLDRGDNNLMGIVYVPGEDDEGTLYGIKMDDKLKKYYRLNRYAQIELELVSDKDIKEIEQLFVWFPPIYEVFVENMKVWCSFDEIKKTLRQRMFLKDGRQVTVNSLAKELWYVIQNPQ